MSTENEAIGAGIRATLAATDFGRELAAEGITTVSLDEDGQLVERHPDGSTVILTPKDR